MGSECGGVRWMGRDCFATRPVLEPATSLSPSFRRIVHRRKRRPGRVRSRPRMLTSRRPTVRSRRTPFRESTCTRISMRASLPGDRIEREQHFHRKPTLPQSQLFASLDAVEQIHPAGHPSEPVLLPAPFRFPHTPPPTRREFLGHCPRSGKGLYSFPARCPHLPARQAGST